MKDVILKIFKSLNRFNSSNKINSHYRGENKEEKKIRINYRTNQNIRITINVFPRSRLSESFPSLWVTVHLCLSRVPSTGLAMGKAQTLIWPYSWMFLPPMSTESRASVVSFAGALIYSLLWELLLYIPQTQNLPFWLFRFYMQHV